MNRDPKYIYNKEDEAFVKAMIKLENGLIKMPVYLAVVSNPLALRFFNIVYKDYDAIELIADVIKGFEDMVQNTISEAQ